MSVDFHPEGSWSASLNVSEGYAHVPCELMGVRGLPSAIPPSELRRRVLPRLRTLTDGEMMRHVRPDEKLAPNIVNCGRSLEDIRQYRDSMIEVVEECIRRGSPLVWS